MTLHLGSTLKRMKIGLALPIVGDDTSIASYSQLRAIALQGEAVGLDSIWVTDHLLFRVPERPPMGMWEAWSLLSALADATERVELGTIVLCTAFRNPAVLAKMAVTVDAISDGRLILGLGAGWHQPEFEAFGIPYDHRVGRFEEALSIIVPLLRDGAVDVDGTYYQARNCLLVPRGPRPGGIPILIGGERPRMLGLTARYADLWNTSWYGQPPQLAERVQELDAACVAAGRAAGAVAATVGVTLLPPGHTGERPDPAQALFGTAEAVAEGLRAYATLGVSHVICRMSPCTPEALDWLGEALRHLRAK